MLRKQFPVVGVVPILVTGLLPAFPGRAGPGPSGPWGWLCFPFVLQNRGGVCISELCCCSTADPAGVVVRAAGPAGVVARGAERAERAACLLGAADAGAGWQGLASCVLGYSKKRRSRDSSWAAGLCPCEGPPRSTLVFAERPA